MPTSRNPQPKFIVDEMAGRLARWLRLAGFDTVYFSRASNGHLIGQALREGRVILTRSRSLLSRRVLPPTLVLKSEFPFEQLRQVVREMSLELDPGRFFTRCGFCNQILEAADPDEVSREVPPYVFRILRFFYRCQECGRIYWAGTHQASILPRLRALLPPEKGEGEKTVGSKQ